MKKKIVFLLSLIIALCIPIATVCADQETVTDTAYRGAGTSDVSGVPINKSSLSNTDYCVNLLGCSAPGIPSNIVAANNLVFRPYTDADTEAANAVNFKNTYCDGANRMYGAYKLGRGANGADFELKKSLGSTSVSSYIDYTLRWNP